MTTKELIEKIENASEWNLEDCRDICERAGLIEEWEATDGDTFESVVFEAIEKLKED